MLLPGCYNTQCQSAVCTVSDAHTLKRLAGCLGGWDWVVEMLASAKCKRPAVETMGRLASHAVRNGCDGLCLSLAFPCLKLNEAWHVTVACDC